MEIINEFIDLVQNYWLTFLLAAFLAAMFSYGWKKGLVKMSFSLISFLLSAVLSRILLPYIGMYLEQNEAFVNWIQEKVELYLYRGAVGEEATAAENTAVELIYQMLGLNKLTQFAAEKIANLILSILIFVVVLILSRLLLRIVFSVLDRVMRLPVLNLINRSTGAVLALIEGFFYIWLFILLLGFFPENNWAVEIARQFDQPGTLPYYIKDANLILRIFAAMMTG